MKRSEFEHVVKAAAEIVNDELVVIGSQSILGQFPEAPDVLLRSAEVDLFPRNHIDRADEIDGSLGDGSRFHETYEYYAHAVGPETPTAPAGWEQRLIRVDLPSLSSPEKTVTVWCMEVHDLILSKLAAGRPHDMQFAVDALRAGLASAERLHLGVRLLPRNVQEAVLERLNGALAQSKGASATTYRSSGSSNRRT